MRASGALAIDDLERQRSFAELDDRTRRLARLMREDLGLAPGDHVAVLMGNRVEGLELVWASILAGVWITPLNWHLSQEELEYVVRDAGAKLLLHDAGHAQSAAELASAAGEPTLVCVGDECPPCSSACCACRKSSAPTSPLRASSWCSTRPRRSRPR